MLGRYRLLVIVALVVAALDQGSKALALAQLEEGEGTPVAGEVFELRLRMNTGVGWSLGAGAGEAVRRVLYPAVAVGLGGLLLWLYRRLREGDRAMRLGVALIVGGGLGNLVDRLRLGSVVDFLCYHVGLGGSTMTGTFNLADVALIAGVCAVALGAAGRRPASEAPEEDAG